MSNIELLRKNDKTFLGMGPRSVKKRHTSNDSEVLIAFRRGDLRTKLRTSQELPWVDFIEVRIGSLPDRAEFADRDELFWSTPFQSIAWLEAWQKHEGNHSFPVTAIGYSEGRPVFLLPLSVFEEFGVRYLSWSAYQQSDYCAPIVNPKFREAFERIGGATVLRQIARRIRGIDLIYLPKQPLVVNGVRNPFILRDSARYHVGAHAINFEDGKGWDKWYADRRGAKTRKRLREKRLNLGKLGSVEISLAQSVAEARATVELCLETKSKQLERAGHWNPFSPEGVKGTLIEYFSQGQGKTTWAVTLKVGGVNMVTAFGFRGDDEWLLYQMAMDSGPASRFSPGTHLLTGLMEHCIGIGVRRLDLALGDETYKSEWCDDHIELHTSTLALTARGRLLQSLTLTKSRVSARIASDPRLYEGAKWVKGVAKKFLIPI